MLGTGVISSSSVADTTSEEEVIVVVGDKFASTIDEVNAQVDVKRLEEIERLSTSSYADLLANVPGVLFEGGPITTGEQITVRGQGGTAVNVRIDGAKQNFVSGHAGQRFFVDPELLDSVEILKGGASNLYGAGGAGVVAIETLKADSIIDRSSEDVSYGGRLRTGYQSVNSEEFGSLAYALGNSKWSLLLNGVYRDSEDIELGSGIDLEGSAIRKRNYLIKSDYIFSDDFEISLGYQYYQSDDQNGANPQAGVSASNSLVDRVLKFQQVNFKFNYNPIDNDLINLNGNIFYNNTSQRRFYLADATSSNFERFNEHELDTLGIDLFNESNFSAWGGEHQLIAGVEFIKDDQDGTETRDTFFVPGTTNQSSGRPDAEQFNLGVYVRDKIKWDNGLSIAAGLRYDYFDTERLSGGDETQTDSELSPKIEVRYDATNDLSFFATYGYSFNAPTLNQLYAEGSHFGVVPTGFPPNASYFEDNFITNDQLEAERSRDIELGVDWSGKNDSFSWNAKLTYFDKKGEDTIDFETSIPTVTNPFFFGFLGPGALTSTFTQAVNIDNTTIKGFEGQFDMNGDRWYASAGFHIIDGENDDTGADLNSIPGDSVYVNVGYDVLDGVSVGWDSRFVGNRSNKVSDANSQTSGYDVHGINIHWKATENLALTVGVTNLFDQEYEVTNINRTEAGRNFFVTGTVNF